MTTNTQSGGFDVVLGNPPWEMAETSEKEFFAHSKPDIAKARTAQIRRRLIADLEESEPALAAAFRAAKRRTGGIRHFVQASGRYPTGSVGRINSYPLFTECGVRLVSQRGRAGLLLPSAIAMDAYNAKLFSWLCNEGRLRVLLDFENRAALFPAVHRSYRFCVLVLSAESTDTAIRLSFFHADVSTLSAPERVIETSTDRLSLYSPNTLAPPMFQCSTDADIADQVYSRFGVLRSKHDSDHRWGVSIQRMLSLSDGSHLFEHAADRDDNSSFDAKLYTGKAIHQFTHRFASWVGESWRNLSDAELEDPAVAISTEYYTLGDEVERRTRDKQPSEWLVGYRDVCRATDERTTIAAILPFTACDTHCRNIYFEHGDSRDWAVFIAVFNSFVFDFFARQKLVSIGLGAGIVEQLPMPPPPSLQLEPWHPRMVGSISWYVQRVVELTYTAWDLQPFARSLGFDGPPFRWGSVRRSAIRAELDAALFHVYDITRDQVIHILESFPIVKRRDEETHAGEYITQTTILSIFDAMARARDEDQTYCSDLDPLPGEKAVPIETD